MANKTPVKPDQKFLQFTGRETVSEILAKMPESSDILLAHGLSCASCHLNAYEPLDQGVLGHGMTQEDLERILADLNEAAQEMKIPPQRKNLKNPKLTKFAAQKIRELQKKSDQVGFGFKIDVLKTTKGEASYFLDFLEKPERGDRVIESQGIKLFLSSQSLKFLQNCEINFVENGNESGFKIEKK